MALVELTRTPMTPFTKNFDHTPIGEELFRELNARLRLAVIAGYLVKNGTGPYVILNLYIDSSNSDPCWKKRIINDSWQHDVQHRQIRDVLFAVLEKHGLETPIEKAYNKETGDLLSDTCFNISLIDFAYWQDYWKKNDR